MPDLIREHGDVVSYEDALFQRNFLCGFFGEESEQIRDEGASNLSVGSDVLVDSTQSGLAVVGHSRNACLSQLNSACNSHFIHLACSLQMTYHCWRY